jgi:DivIVA domain-containing protein
LPLDRQDIERRDFPITRRGYDTAAVDAHLRRLADETEDMRSSPGVDTLASAASDQVRAIVEAAETTSAEMQREADEEARSIRERAESEAERALGEATSRAQEHVANVSEATQVMLQRVDAMESELGALIESLRTGANRLTADLTLLQGNLGELRSATGQGAAPVEREAFEAESTDTYEDLPAEQEEYELEPEAPAPADTGSEGARLIALNMALNGTPREETDRYLAENFDLADRESLLDEVYSRVG